MRAALHIPGHFGEWLQGRLGADGPVVLVTLPAPALGLDLCYRPGPGLSLRGAGLTPARARRFLDLLGLSLRGRIVLRPVVAPGLGTGVSTASLVALARLAGWNGAPEILARACVAAEGASDPLMFAAPERMLWASRQGRALAALPALPRHEILGGFSGDPARTEATDSAFPDVTDLVARWRGAATLADFAAIATESAARCSALRGPFEETAPQLAADLGALGWLRAHTGAARGLIFAPGTVPAGAGAALRAAGWRGLVRIRGGGR
ncbi:propanediol utilization protein [Rhodobacter capsulatus]|uniref:Propanediol utilization protein n=1 Tax=Rhodobacter capsulatus TaxID=1061 RepID=A0A4U1JTX0_RHOCA|nr:propanediol utilization protein [Rhodobacter capsulatus]TKD21979.1 propanediol utilization protein [Rhodobacter capsulatus]